VAHPAGVVVANRDDLTGADKVRLSRALGQTTIPGP
jgi:hypothetical protein